jgi:hypothetical protein
VVDGTCAITESYMKIDENFYNPWTEKAAFKE